MAHIDEIIRLSVNRLGDALQHQLVIIRNMENMMHQAMVDSSKISDLKELLDNLRDVRRRLRSEMSVIHDYPINDRELAMDAETLARYYIEAAWKTESRLLRELSRILDTKHDIDEVNANKRLAERLVNKLASKS